MKTNFHYQITYHEWIAFMKYLFFKPEQILDFSTLKSTWFRIRMTEKYCLTFHLLVKTSDVLNDFLMVYCFHKLHWHFFQDGVSYSRMCHFTEIVLDSISYFFIDHHSISQIQSEWIWILEIFSQITPFFWFFGRKLSKTFKRFEKLRFKKKNKSRFSDFHRNL